MSHENIKDHVKVYRNVFISLLILTILTVTASKITYFEDLHLIEAGIFIGLLIAFFKGYLVAANFMHLNDESSTIYGTLILTIVFLVLLFAIPKLWENNLVISETTTLYDDLGKQHSNDRGHP